MYPGNPGGGQVSRNCDWLAGQEVRDVGFICFIYILIAQQGPGPLSSLSSPLRYLSQAQQSMSFSCCRSADFILFQFVSR